MSDESKEPIHEDPPVDDSFVPEQDQFIKVPILRGFTEIREIHKVVTDMGGVICGGWARYCCSPRRKPEPASDVDVFPTSESAYENLKAFFLKEGFEIYHENNISLTLKTPKFGKWAHTPRVQLIKAINQGHIVTTGNLEEILQNFDFTVVRIAIIDSNEALADNRYLEDERKRRLRLINIHCPVSSMLRCMKYSRRGYFMPPSEAINLFIDWEGRTDEYRLDLINMLKKSVKDGKEMTREEIEKLESLLRMD